MATPTVSLLVQRSASSDKALVSVVPPADGEPSRLSNLVLVIDKSGSMSLLANDNSELPYKRLELLARALELIVAGMEDGATLTIVTFESRVDTVFGPAAMTPVTRLQAIAAVMQIKAGGGTDLWYGLECGLKHAKATDAQVFLLTDGEADHPPGGERAALKAVRDAGNRCAVTTIAFGPNAEVALLADLGSRYVHIYDGTMVITAFAHLLAALQSECLRSAELRLSNGTVVPIGPVRFGQPRTVLVPADLAEGVRLVLPDGKLIEPAFETNEGAVRAECQRVAGMDVLRYLIKEGGFDREAAAGRIRDVVRSFGDDEPPIKADLKGDVMLALAKGANKDNWAQWGKDFVPALLSAHLAQVPGNVKDPGCQGYCPAGPFRRRLRFCNETGEKMPPPVAAAAKTQVDQATYVRNVVNATGGGSCFGLSTRVLGANGDWLVAGDITPGTVLDSGATVLKVVYSDGDLLTVDVDGARLTSTHPVRFDGDASSWLHAVNASRPTGGRKERVVNFVLSAVHVIRCQTDSGCPLFACTLAHGLDGPVVGHPFYGTPLVLDALSAYPGWAEGVVTVPNGDVRRDERGWVVDIRSP